MTAWIETLLADYRQCGAESQLCCGQLAVAALMRVFFVWWRPPSAQAVSPSVTSLISQFDYQPGLEG